MASRALRKLVVALVLVVSGVLVAFLVIIWADYSRMHWTPGRNALAAAGFTAITFFAVAYEFKKQWRRWAFWAVWSGLLLVHGTAYWLLIREIPEWPSIAFVVIAMAETTGLCLFLDKIGFESQVTGHWSSKRPRLHSRRRHNSGAVRK